MTVSVDPALDPADGAYRLGAWVRDSTAGIGTLSFYDPADDTFGALGHAITDVDTGIVLPVGYGGIYESAVVDIEKARAASPENCSDSSLTQRRSSGKSQIIPTSVFSERQMRRSSIRSTPTGCRWARAGTSTPGRRSF